jgi:hypothetical protein
MRTVGIIGGAIIALMGVVWMLQGMGSTLAPQSFMTNAREWIAFGVLTAVAGVALAMWSARKPH